MRTRGYQMLKRTVEEMNDAALMDPSSVFSTAQPGFLQELVENIGPWESNNTKRWQFYGVGDQAKAVGPNERARQGQFDAKHVVGLPGMEVAGPTHDILPIDYVRGLDARGAAKRVQEPILQWNRVASHTLLDIVTQGAYSRSDDTPQEGFAWTVDDFDGDTHTQDLFSEADDSVPTVVANSSQSMAWPLRDGTETSTGHDHVIDAAGGADWTLALGRTHRDLITEHAMTPIRVRAIVGVDIAEDIRGVMKSELDAVESRREFIDRAFIDGGGFCDATPIVENLEGVSYFHAPDLPDDLAVYYASGMRPHYFAPGRIDDRGDRLDTGAWSEMGNPETRGTKYGFRSYLSAGTHNPVASVVAKFDA